MARVEQSPVPIQAWLDAENAVIGSLLLDERLAPPILATVDASDFGNRDNRRIYQAARAVKAARRGQVQGQVQFREIPDPGNLPL